MITKIIFLFIVLQTTLAQIDGNFWWMKKKMVKITGMEPPKPVFEKLNGFETDESDKIVFEDDVPFVTRDKISEDKTHLKFQVNTKLNLNISKNSMKSNNIEPEITKNHRSSKESVEDLLNFKFPGDAYDETTINRSVIIFNVTENLNNITGHNETDQKVTTNDQADTIKIQSVLPIKIKPIDKTPDPEAEPICTFVSDEVCNEIGGVVYSKFYTLPVFKSCCIFPMGKKGRHMYRTSRIYFPDEFKTLKRSKRSAAHEQRNAMLRRTYTSGFNNFGPRLPTISTNIATRIVTPAEDDDVDPYWNIKTSNDKNLNSKSEYGVQEYGDYAAELPKPGLTGIYSDYGKPLWSYPSNPNPYGGGEMMSDEDDDDDNTFFGYGTVDPRKVLKGRPMRPKVRPINIKATSNEDYYDNESETIQYHSNPDFKVLEGFKLLNLSRNRTKSFSKNTKKTTVNFDSDEYSATRPTFNLDSEYPDFMDINHSECYKLKAFESQRNLNIGNGSSPWLALAKRTRKPKTVLCYATIVHARAAVTTAECVYGMSPGEVTVLSGMWDLNHDRVISQQRLASVMANPLYVSGKMANNIALLYWKVPLRFGANVRAASMSDPYVGDDCRFIGWGGYDVAMRPRPRVQTATILTPRACKTRLFANNPATNLPNEAFCATINHQSSVTGIGGPLTCQIDEKETLVGIAVLRDNIIVLQPVDWARQAVNDLPL